VTPVKYLLAQSLIVAFALLAPNIALGQELYTECDIAYDPETNIITAVGHFYPDYVISYYYTIGKSLEVLENGTMTDNTGPQDPPYDTAIVYRDAQPDTDYAAYAGTELHAFFCYFYFDPYPYGYYCYYDPFYFDYWGSSCDGIGSVVCKGEGPPMWIIIIEIFAAGYAHREIHTPACDYPTALNFDSAQSGGLETLVLYKWTTHLHGQDISYLRYCNVKEEIDFTGVPSYPPPVFKDWSIPQHYRPNPVAVLQPQGDEHAPGGLALPYSAGSITGSQNVYFSCPCYNRNAWTQIRGPMIMVYKVMSIGGGHWVYQFHKDGSLLNVEPLQ
jgi:hypothetical protein